VSYAFVERLRKPAYVDSDSHLCSVHADGPDTGCTDRLHDRSMHARDHITPRTSNQLMPVARLRTQLCNLVQELQYCRKADQSILTALFTCECVETVEIACVFLVDIGEPLQLKSLFLNDLIGFTGSSCSGCLLLTDCYSIADWSRVCIWAGRIPWQNRRPTWVSSSGIPVACAHGHFCFLSVILQDTRSSHANCGQGVICLTFV